MAPRSFETIDNADLSFNSHRLSDIVSGCSATTKKAPLGGSTVGGSSSHKRQNSRDGNRRVIFPDLCKYEPSLGGGSQHTVPVDEGPGPKRRSSTSSRPSILRSKSSSLKSSVPSLVSLDDDDDGSEYSSSDAPLVRRNNVSFDARVWIREFERSDFEIANTWYTASDLEKFQRLALAQVLRLNSTQLLPTGTGRTIQTKKQQTTARSNRPSFTHAAFNLDDEVLERALEKECSRGEVVRRELKRILIVDPHDMCLKLFAKAFKNVLPHADVVIACTNEQAIRQFGRGEFDMIVVEERLGVQRPEGPASRGIQSSGSVLLKMFQVKNKTNGLLIGVSAHLEQDRARLQGGGADFCWGKPPPMMDEAWKNSMMRALLLKRGQTKTAAEFFPRSG